MPARTLAAVAVGLLAAVPLVGQKPDSTTSPRDSLPSPPRLGPVIVTGTTTPARASAFGLAATVLSDSLLAARQPQYAADAFRGITGAVIDEAVGPGGPTILRLRGGEEVFTQVLMDGVPINQNGGFFDFQGLSLTNVERIEVVRGPQSAVYGSSAVSGTAQFITRRGRPGPPTLRGSLEGAAGRDMGGSFRSEAAVSGGTGLLQYSGGVGLIYNRGIHAIPHDTWTRDVSVRLDASPHAKWELLALFRYMDIESDLPVRDPGATRVPLDSNARDERQRLVGSIQAAFHPTQNWSHRLRGSLYAENFLYEDTFDDVASSGPYDFFVFDANFLLDSRLRRLAADYQSTLELGSGGSLNVTLGGRVEHEQLTDETAGDFGDGTLELDRASVAGFGEARLRISQRARLLLGARIEKYEDVTAELTPRVSASVDVLQGWLTARGTVGRAFKAPNLQQQYQENPFILSNPDLEAETSVSWELGIELRRLRGLDLSVGYFQQRFDDLIQLVPSEVDERLMYRNLSSARVSGVEFAVTGRPGRRWTLGAEGAWLTSRVLDNAGLAQEAFPTDSALPFRPRFSGSGFVQWDPSRHVSGLIRARTVGSQIALTERFSGERAPIDPYVLLGLYLQYRLAGPFALYGRIENVLDTRYQTAFDQPGIRRTIAVGFRIEG
jgi:outer membrane cobalamin receptor